jgi:hypothetical protein
MKKFLDIQGLSLYDQKIKDYIGSAVGAKADDSVFGASGNDHSKGLVPDPGATAGSTKYLREDGTWAVPAGGSGGSQVQADWNENDAEAKSYVKNRTHWEESPTPIELYSTKVTLPEFDGHIVGDFRGNDGIVDLYDRWAEFLPSSHYYDITLDGTLYHNACFDSVTCTLDSITTDELVFCCGNLDLLWSDHSGDVAYDNSLPFIIVWTSNGTWLLTKTAGQHTLVIKNTGVVRNAFAVSDVNDPPQYGGDELVVGNAYPVSINGTVYNLECWDVPDLAQTLPLTYLGNGALIKGILASEGLPGEMTELVPERDTEYDFAIAIGPGFLILATRDAGDYLVVLNNYDLGTVTTYSNQTEVDTNPYTFNLVTGGDKPLQNLDPAQRGYKNKIDISLDNYIGKPLRADYVYNVRYNGNLYENITAVHESSGGMSIDKLGNLTYSLIPDTTGLPFLLITHSIYDQADLNLTATLYTYDYDLTEFEVTCLTDNSYSFSLKSPDVSNPDEYKLPISAPVNYFKLISMYGDSFGHIDELLPENRLLDTSESEITFMINGTTYTSSIKEGEFETYYSDSDYDFKAKLKYAGNLNLAKNYYLTTYMPEHARVKPYIDVTDYEVSNPGAPFVIVEETQIRTEKSSGTDKVTYVYTKLFFDSSVRDYDIKCIESGSAGLVHQIDKKFIPTATDIAPNEAGFTTGDQVYNYVDTQIGSIETLLASI